MQIGPIARRIAAAAWPVPLFTRIAAWGALVVVLVPGIMLSPAMPFMYLPSFDKLNKEVATILPYVQEERPEHVMVLNTSGPFQTIYPPAILEHLLGRSIDVRVLSSLNGVVSVERIDDHSFVLRTNGPGWLTNIFAAMLRSPRRPRVGEVYEKDIFTATHIEMTPGGSDVLAVSFRMRQPLGDPGTLYVAWNGEVFQPIELTALPVGEAVILADTSDVWASMW